MLRYVNYTADGKFSFLPFIYEALIHENIESDKKTGLLNWSKTNNSKEKNKITSINKNFL